MSNTTIDSLVDLLPYKIKDISLAQDGRNAIEISEKIGLPKKVVNRAKKLIGDKTVKLEKLIGKKMNRQSQHSPALFNKIKRY